jgi:hypothetical protein
MHKEFVLTDWIRITRAFNEIEGEGIITDKGNTCCQSCGAHELGSDDTPYVFFHEQDELDAFGDDAETLDSDLYLSYSDAGTAITAVGILRDHGLQASWDGDINRRIRIAV